MLEDVLIIEGKHRQVAKDLLNLLDLAHPKKRLIIAIGGESGSGKSVISHMLAKYLKKQKICAKIIHSDDFYRIPPKERSIWRQSRDISAVGLDEYDWEKIHIITEGFLNKAIVEMPCVDLLTDQVDILRTNFEDIDLLILEGLYALHANADIKIFLDIPYSESMKAQELRGKELPDEFRLKVLEQEHCVIQSLRKEASIIITKDMKIILTEVG